METVYLIDTNVLLFDAKALESVPNAEIIVPLAVIEDLDHFKRGTDETARNARKAAQFFDFLRQRGSLREGVSLDNGAIVKIVPGEGESSSGDAILNLGLKLKEEGRKVVVMSKSVTVRLRADLGGLDVSDFGVERPLDTDVVRGWRRIPMKAENIARLKSGIAIKPKPGIFHSNEYVFGHDAANPKNGCCARYFGQSGELWPLKDTTRRCCGVHALNMEQTFTLDALLDPEISLVTLAGRAGTGKTLLAIAAALHQIFVENRYSKLIVFRPTMPVSRDLGYLPGDVNEKMRPWMQPVYDALELIRSLDRQSPSRTLPNDIMNCQEISVEPLTYIRGRSIPNQFIIIDEAQNLTPLEVKTAITRVGNGSKMVLTGDPAQIDNPYVDAASNGLTKLVASFLDSPLAAHITLVKGERSLLAETPTTLFSIRN